MAGNWLYRWPSKLALLLKTAYTIIMITLFKSFILLLVVSAVLVFPAFASAEDISSFRVVIEVKTDASFNVAETIQYNFSDASRHGIYRDIPVKYQARGGNYTVKISNISVVDEDGQPYKFISSPSGNSLRIKIGDADTFVSGVKTYAVHYTVKRAINFFDDHDELYWNVTGNGWEVPMSSVQATVTLPQPIASDSLQTKCFFGILGSSQVCDRALQTLGTLTFAEDSLANGEGMTVVVGFPKGIVVQPTHWEKIRDIVKDNIILVLPLLVLGALFYGWRKRGRDPQGYGTIVAQYGPPDNLTPGEVGTLVDETADNKDITSIIVDLAVRGYIKITKIEEKKFLHTVTDYQFEALKDFKDLKGPGELTMARAFFTLNSTVTKLSKLKEILYKDVKDARDEVYSALVIKGYFLKNPQTVRWTYWGVTIAVAVLGFVVGVFTQQLIALGSFMLSAVFIFMFGFIMPARTAKGAQARQYILGLKKYLEVAEKDRLNFHNSPEKTPEHFDKLLPYAMVLGVEKAWAKQFEGIYTSQPSWYNDPTGARFSALIFVSHLNSFTATTTQAIVSQPSASHGGSGLGGGGFSGGGFGGGGGGSW